MQSTENGFYTTISRVSVAAVAAMSMLAAGAANIVQRADLNFIVAIRANVSRTIFVVEFVRACPGQLKALGLPSQLESRRRARRAG